MTHTVKMRDQDGKRVDVDVTGDLTAGDDCPACEERMGADVPKLEWCWLHDSKGDYQGVRCDARCGWYGLA